MTAPRAALKPLDEAMRQLLAHAAPVPGLDHVSTFEADGRVLADDLIAALDVPGHDNTSMDGYAVRRAEVTAALAAGQALPVSQRVPAGHPPSALQMGSVARVFTGAWIPPGADAVVMQEAVSAETGADGQTLARFGADVAAGQWIRRRGEDVRAGAAVLRAGTVLDPAALGLAASLGFAELPVRPRPRVALFSTGDELVMPGTVPPQELPPGAIYNSNRFFLRALLERMGCVVSDLGIVPDRREATVDALREAATGHDLILTSGGVSVGEEDHIKPAVQQLGTLELWQLAIKPGKPFAYGALGASGGKCHFIGLPGNPVSSYVTFLLLVRPFLLALQGVPEPDLPAPLMLPAHFDLPRPDKRREFLRARRDAEGGVVLFDNQSSGVLTSVVWADGLVDNPQGHVVVRGDPVRFLPLDAFWN